MDLLLIDVEGEYHGNDAQLEKVFTEIDSMVLNQRMKVERITVVGTNALIKILQSRYSFPYSIYAVSTIP
ncbi:MAG: hypothetical protein NC127_06480 [Muribaculum sp.]|nr:hypothetical protein [Muribaculum sp.]